MLTKQNRLFAIALALTMLFVMLSSVWCIAAAEHHDCLGAGCPLCYQLNLCKSALESLGCGLVALAFAAGLLCRRVRGLSAVFRPYQEQQTLVTLRVKLSC